MIRYTYGDQLSAFPALGASMFRDRARQFSNRLKWEVHVDAQGREKDAYDDLNPLYIICEDQNGLHAGSMRFLPTVGRVMVNEHFSDLTGGGAISSPLIWECTRFCVSPRAEADVRVPAALTLAAAIMSRNFALNHIVAVFDARMVKIYSALDWSPEIIGTSGRGRNAVSVGLWDVANIPFDRIIENAGISRECIDFWFQQSFDTVGKVGLSA